MTFFELPEIASGISAFSVLALRLLSGAAVTRVCGMGGEIMRIESLVGVVTAVMMSGGAIEAEPQECRQSSLPANIEVARYMESVVRIDAGIPQCCRAFTRIERSGAHIRADVHLPPAPITRSCWATSSSTSSSRSTGST